MPLGVQKVVQYLEELAPRRLAFEWDNAGLLVGSLHGEVNRILVTLDVDSRTVDEAAALGADFIVAHHPVIFRPFKAIRTDLPAGRLLELALAAGIRIYAAHTNLDVARGGVSDALAARLGLVDTTVLRVTGRDALEKIVVFVPEGYEDEVREAMAAAGAGAIGNYSHCTFQTAGTGTFVPLAGANPFIGQQGRLEKTAELRLETIVPASRRTRVVRAMLDAHPYEEVAFDIYPLHNEGEPYGLGRLGRISKCTLEEFCSVVKERLGVQSLRVVGDANRIVAKVAVCGGAGADLVQAALFAGADVLVTGDLKYHEAHDAKAHGLAVIDAGHDATEKVIVSVLCRYLEEKIAQERGQVEVVASTVDTAPWRTL